MTVQLSETQAQQLKERLEQHNAAKEFLRSPRRPVEGTQKHRVLTMLEEAGDKGVLSLTFIENYMPRVASRVWELKRDGWDIRSKPEGEFARYVLVKH